MDENKTQIPSMGLVNCSTSIVRSRDEKSKPIVYDEIDVSSDWPTESESFSPLLDDSWLDNQPFKLVIMQRERLSQRGEIPWKEQSPAMGIVGRKLWLDGVFNPRVGRVQRVAKEAFRRLKGRWRCLKEITEVKLQDLPLVLGACCVLHNICEMRNEVMDPADAIFEIFDNKIAPENRVTSVVAMQARDQIAYRLLRAAADKQMHLVEPLIAPLE
ncbi:hypothetical protein Vadar_015618 [Vaccinium darrowii]|uniref:Uncharacterized protein n=1 Tax=Vaccinium darrowii TaxID=229202 RepID=A0ACB7YDM7_9ERIC|nr:hypothetical protein Vadar_015618 [Vaccinium darrowii]